MLDVDAYLQRLHYAGARRPTAETLAALHRAHMLAVPFENLDIGLGRPLSLDEAALFDKIVCRGRGGFCYELNGLFAALLRALGYQVSLLSARVYDGERLGPEYDHLALLVQLDAPWLADVGFGDSFLEPLRLDEPGEQAPTFGGRAYRVTRDGAEWQVEERHAGGRWTPVYRFALRPRDLGEFAAMCQYHQTSAESHFTQHRVCSRATPSGRISLSDQRLIITVGSEREERVLEGEAAWAAALREHFGIELPRQEEKPHAL